MNVCLKVNRYWFDTRKSWEGKALSVQGRAGTAKHSLFSIQGWDGKALSVLSTGLGGQSTLCSQGRTGRAKHSLFSVQGWEGKALSDLNTGL